MTDEHDETRLRGLGLEPGDLDGHTIEELSDYLDAGRQPADPSIEESPGCRLALDALERLRGVTAAMLAADEASSAPVDDSWVDRILSGIALDARAGRRIPIDSGDAHIDLGVTEGAVRGVIRGAELLFPGMLVGRCRLDGDVAAPGAPIRVEIEVSVPYGEPIPALAEGLRAEVRRRLAVHTELVVSSIDITIEDVSREEEGGTR